MFDDDDFPFRAMGAMSQMHRSMMQDMDQMMSSMMGGVGPFGRQFGTFPGFPGPFGPPAISDGTGQRPTQRRQQIEMDPFAGFGGLLGTMALVPPQGLFNPPGPMSNGSMFVSTSITSVGPDGRPRVEQQTMHQTGGVTETKKRVDHNGESTMTIGHQIGDRSHYIEKKRDKDGNVRKNQKFVNLDEASAEDFDREFAQRVRSNYGYGSGSRRNNSQAIEEDRTSRRNQHHHHHSRNGITTTSNSSRNAPIITLPDEEEAASSSSSGRHNRAGPIIREISEEEAEQSIPKRRRGHFGAFRAE